MINKIIKSCFYLNVAVSILILSGCGSQNAYNKRYYVLNAERKAETVKASNKTILDVRRFTIDSAFESKGLVYRKGEFEYEADFYNEFLISPATMVTEKTRTWLSKSGLFARVLDKGSYIEPSHTLEGNITALYGDLRERKSIMEIRIFLITNVAPKDSAMMARNYRASHELKSETTESLIEAFDNCLRQILTELEKDLREKL